jgi:hypothetical protein
MTQVPTHPRMRQPKPNNNNMKIRTSISINSEDTDYIFEISDENPNNTTITERFDKSKQTDIVLTIPNEDLTKFIQAIQEHIKIHGL